MKLTETNKQAIREEYSTSWVSYQELANKYGCSETIIGAIVAGVPKGKSNWAKRQAQKMEKSEKMCKPLKGETFKEHPYHVGIWVSDFGRVVNRNTTFPYLKKSSIWAPSPYPSILVYPDRKKRYIHELVCETFHGLRPEGMSPKGRRALYTVSHLDNTPTNNRADNLAWVTGIDNFRNSPNHAVNLRGKDHPAHKALGCKKLTLEQARMMRKDRAEGIGVRDLAQKYNRCISTVYLILQEKTFKEAN